MPDCMLIKLIPTTPELYFLSSLLGHLYNLYRVKKDLNVDHIWFFGGFAGFSRLLSSSVVCIVVYAKVP